MRRLAGAARAARASLRAPRLASRALTADAAPAEADWLAGNAAAVLTRPGELEFMQWPLSATPPHGCVRVAVQRVGICGSDVHYWRHNQIADFVVTAPMVLGHEASGEVVQLGGGVTSPRVGTRVALEPGVPCWASALSRAGRYNLDPGIVFAATPPHHGTLAQFVDHPAPWCYPLPDTVSLEEGAFCEPLSVGLHAARRARVAPGARVAVLGAGPIGLVTLAAARVFGADAVAVTDLSQRNLRAAEAAGAAATLQVARGEAPAHTAAALVAALGGEPDIVIDCCGVQSTMATALAACARGGTVVLVGMGSQSMTLPLTAAAAREIDIRGSFRYANTYPLALSLLASKRIDVAPLITHRFGWSAAQMRAGFEAAANAERSGAIKVMFCDLAERAEAPPPAAA